MKYTKIGTLLRFLGFFVASFRGKKECPQHKYERERSVPCHICGWKPDGYKEPPR